MINNIKIKILIQAIGLWSILLSCKEQRSDLYIKDAIHIQQAFIDNVESCRRIYSYHKNGFTINETYKDLPDSLTIYSEDVFGGYAIYRDDNTHKCYVIPRPTNEWLEVEVGSISYSADSLKCVALVIVKNNSYSYTNQKPKGLYNGHAIIGIRTTKKDQFKIYPEEIIILKSFPSKDLTLNVLKRYYYNLKGDYTPQSGVPYKCGINDPVFFETAHEFTWIDSLNLYWCQTGMEYGKRYPYVYYSNQDSTINKHLCDN